MNSPHLNQSIFLVGPMGSGKSAVGRRLAKDLQRQFIDSDDVIEERTGVDIPFIFEKEGEAGFRHREHEIIGELTDLAAVVLATGGGAILHVESRRWLKSRGLVVYLHASVAQQLKRTRHGKERPLLNQGDTRQILDELMIEREPLYREIADVVVKTDGRSVASVAGEVSQKLETLTAAAN